MNQLSKVMITLILVAAPRMAAAIEVFEFHTGVRQLGMGGAYTAVVNDETALLSNPAGLGKIRDVTVTMIDPEIHGSLNNLAMLKGDNFTNIFNMQGLLNILNENDGKHWHGKVQMFPSVVAPNFGMGILAKWSYDGRVLNGIYRYDYTNDFSFALGHCLRFFDGIVKFGFTGRAVNRIEVRETISALGTDYDHNTFAKEGLGIAGDAGFIITLPVAGLPAIAIVGRDIGMTSYAMSDGVFRATEGRPEPTPTKVDVGGAIYPILGNQTRLTLTAEYHDVLTSGQEKDQFRRLHAGLEVNFSDFFFLRAGMNQRYWTTGFEVASERFQLQFATYGEEIGTSSAPLEDRRAVGKFSLRF